MILGEFGQKSRIELSSLFGIHLANGFAMPSPAFVFPESKQKQGILVRSNLYYACVNRCGRDRSSRLSLGLHRFPSGHQFNLHLILISKVAECVRLAAPTFPTLSHA